jgi:hypothetical protein
MKKLAFLLLAVLMLTASTGAFAETRLGQSIYPAHGTRAFCVTTVAMEGDVITAVLIDEYQFLGEGFIPVPNPENFTNEAGNALSSKRVNNEAYSAMMTERGGATLELLTSYQGIEAFCVGKTIAELEAFIEGKVAEDLVDAITSCTLEDTLGYIEAVIEAAKAV